MPIDPNNHSFFETPHSEAFEDYSPDGDENILKAFHTEKPSEIRSILDASERAGDITITEHINPE